VFPGTLASQYFVSGDIVLGIQGYNAKDLLHMEAIDLVRKPMKSLELLIQKTDHIPASIWGPEPVLERPCQWLRQSPSSIVNAYSEPKTRCRPASMLGQHSEAVSQNAFQQEVIVRTGYTPTTPDSRIEEKFECLNSTRFETSTKMPQTMYETQGSNQVSSVTQSVASDLNQLVTKHIRHCSDNTYYAHEHGKVYREVKQVNHNLQTPQESHQGTSEIPQTANNVRQSQESIRETPDQEVQNISEPKIFTLHPVQESINKLQNNSSKKVAGNTKERLNVNLGFPGSSDTEQYKIKPVTGKPRIPTTADILERPISPDFTMYPNSKSNSLLKMVLSKSLRNFSQDFEKMKASVIEIYDDCVDDEGSDTEEDEDEDDNAGEDPGSVSCDSSLAGSGSMIFERCWMAEHDEGGYSDDSELGQQYDKCPDSLSRNSSGASVFFSLPGLEDYTG
jgi:hypothetical protein